jgi:phosphopantetheinyl transferase (holo-ACP synthase)
MEILSGKSNLVHWSVGSIITLNQHGGDFLPEELKESEGNKIDKRRQEYLAIRRLKHEAFPNDTIIYLPNGKPVLKNNKLEIGISHSNHWALFAYSERAFGCDIEEVSSRLLTVQERFCRASELYCFESTDRLRSLTILWSCKESIYKLVQEPGIHFKTGMICNSVKGNRLNFTVHLAEISKEIHCEVIPFEHAILTIATHEQ